METKELYCTIKGDFTRLPELIKWKGYIERLKLKDPCQGCIYRSKKRGAIAVEKLNDEFDTDSTPSGELNIVIIPHEDNPSVPNDVVVGDPIVSSCSYDFNQ